MSLNTSPTKLAVLLDFDGTVTERDIGDLVVQEFALPGWRDTDEPYRRGEINVRELWGHQISHLRFADVQAMTEFACREAKVRPGLVELTEFCAANGITVEIASSGIMFYIQAVLKQAGLSSLLIAAPSMGCDTAGMGTIEFEDGLRDCASTAMCKCVRVWRQRRMGREVLFVGDGATDYCAAQQADYLMARDRLAHYCGRDGVAFKPFEDFRDVLREVKGLVECENGL
jgi:2,3-diketo-5-methylthio-1-phosphopentane phosphatase